MKLIVGLGNPGPAYSRTRHNVGMRVAEKISKQWAIPLRAQGCSSKFGEGSIAGHPVRLALPQTFMNASGKAVECLLHRWRLQPSSLLIVCDDVSLPLGMIRLRSSGSAGGHLGLASILQGLGTEEIPRLRVGIQSGRVDEDLASFVLSRFVGSERKSLEHGLASAVEACGVWVTSGLSAAMNRFNRRNPAFGGILPNRSPQGDLETKRKQ